MNREQFWEIRAANYDKLFWAKDDHYIQKILELSQFKKTDVVLDVGSGTAIVANAIKPLVKHVVAMDVSDAMLAKGNWSGISVIKWDVSDGRCCVNNDDRIINQQTDCQNHGKHC